ncbi:MAG: hypothetical protein II887_02015 [Bacteroidales bacterium]|nr:hypothetical protein [Bacteroidales bacterium]
MKKTILVLLILALAGQMIAQQVSGKKRGEAVAIGLRVGGNLASYYYTENADLNDMEYAAFMERLKFPMVGLNVEIPLFNGYMYVAPEVSFTGRGDSRWLGTVGLDTVRYKAQVNYLEGRLPISVAIPVTSWFKSYVYAAPSFGVALPSLGSYNFLKSEFVYSERQGVSDTLAVSTSNMSPYDLGLTVGAGLRFLIDFNSFKMVVKIEGGYHMGFFDTYSEKEHIDQAAAINLNPTSGHQYNVVGERLNRGIEGAVTIAIPLDFHSSDDCFYWSDVMKKKDRSRGLFGF